MYLTYDEYKSMGGTAEEPAFTRLCTAACGRIDRLTHGRIHGLDEVPEAVRLAAFELIHRAESYEAEDARMASFTNDGMSVSYVQETAPQRDSSLNSVVIDLSLIHISEPTRQAEISYAVFCLKKKKKKTKKT